MEIAVILGPGGGRDTSIITSAADTILDMSEFAGQYVELSFNQAARCSFIPAAQPNVTYALAPSAAVPFKSKPSAPVGGGTVTITGKDVDANVVIHRYVSPMWPRLIVRAQSTSVTATLVNVASDKVQL
jgi:hypothetical protein